MNILITTKCSKGCSFCFAQDKNKNLQEMSRENFSKLLDFVCNSSPPANFKLLGGEPTEHPLFSEFLQEIGRRKLKFGFITNGLWKNPDIQQAILQAVDQEYMQSILFNVSELNKDQRLNIFKSNYEPFLAKAKKPGTFHISCGITLSRHKSVSEEADYVRWLLDNAEIHHLRLSLDFLGDNSDDHSFINNKTYGQKIMLILQECLNRQVVLNGDCILYPCLFDDHFFVKKKLPSFMEKLNWSCHPEAMPFDVYPDLSYFHCYPAHGFRGKNLLVFNNHPEARRDMILRKKVLDAHKKIPGVCRECSYLKEKTCNSLCLGCLALEESKILQTKS